VIYKLRDLLGVEELGGTMRLGAYECLLQESSHAREAYGTTKISERHRHRYEFNRTYEEQLVSRGLRVTGRSEDSKFVEICEIPNHPWFLGCQFHPEFKSKPLEAHPLFKAFIGAAFDYRQKRLAAVSTPLFAQEGADGNDAA
jgi:CTP synthase